MQPIAWRKKAMFRAPMDAFHLESAPPQGALDAMRAESPDIIELSVLKL